MDSCQQVAERVQNIALPIVQALALELVEVTCSGRGPQTLLRVFIDKPGGVLIRDCEQVHQSLSHALDVEDPIPHSYTLEVSSPGLDRPFRTCEEYRRARGHQIRVKLNEPFEGQWLLVGELLEIHETGITIKLLKKKSSQIARLPWETIVRSQREIVF